MTVFISKCWIVCLALLVLLHFSSSAIAETNLKTTYNEPKIELSPERPVTTSKQPLSKGLIWTIGTLLVTGVVVVTVVALSKKNDDPKPAASSSTAIGSAFVSW